jgi:lipoprotein-anchoring transpeptidase ErfK/SrfK
VPGIHVFKIYAIKTWMAGTNAGYPLEFHAVDGAMLVAPSRNPRPPSLLVSGRCSLKSLGIRPIMRTRPSAEVLLVIFLLLSAVDARADSLSPATVNAAEFSGKTSKKAKLIRRDAKLILKAQILLDRAGFSSGVIDAAKGGNFTKALAAFQRENGLNGTGKLDEASWTKLAGTSSEPALTEYEITRDDVRGPFEDIPADWEKKAQLKHLSYNSPRELLAEKFHMDEDLLARLNPDVAFDQAGTRIVVANVPQTPVRARGDRIQVDKKEWSVRVFDGSGKVIAYYPASIGSDEKPAPSGTHRITRIVTNPVYVYDPAFGFPGVDATKKLRIAPGPNNPVGSVWMNLTQRTYGIHGTAEPAKVGKVHSHGCVRLTNWDARALAALVKKGTAVDFVE